MLTHLVHPPPELGCLVFVDLLQTVTAGWQGAEEHKNAEQESTVMQCAQNRMICKVSRYLFFWTELGNDLGPLLCCLQRLWLHALPAHSRQALLCVVSAEHARLGVCLVNSTLTPSHLLLAYTHFLSYQ